MIRRDRIILSFLGLLLAVLVVAQLLAPEPLDWRENYEQDAVEPYGSQVLYEVLPALLPGAEVQPVTMPPYLVFRDTTRTAQTYLFVTYAFSPDPAEVEALLDFIDRGNTVFAAARFVRGALADTLNLDVEIMEDWLERLADMPERAEADTAVMLTFVNPALRRDPSYRLEGDATPSHITRLDTARATVLGTYAGGEVNFVRYGIGDGALFIHTSPLVFTNVHLLEDDAEYTWKALSYLPVQDVLWDTYYKPLRSEVRTPLRYVLSDRSLRGAVYVTLAGIVLFMLFEAKRRQRVIPVVEPPKNETLAFVETVGRLYLQRGDHADLVQKKIRHFLDHVRTQLHLPTRVLDDDFVHRLAERSGVPEPQVREVVTLIRQLDGKDRIDLADLHRLHDLVEAFYERSGGVGDGEPVKRGDGESRKGGHQIEGN